MGKHKKKGSGKGTSVMRRSDVPYAQRLRAQQIGAIKAIRDRSAQITMFCHAAAIHELFGKGYKSLVRLGSSDAGQVAYYGISWSKDECSVYCVR